MPPAVRQSYAVYEIVVGGDRVDKLAYYEVRFWDTAKRQREGEGKYVIDGQPADLMNSFKMQIRENHQRIVTLPGDDQFPEGYTRHVSGLAIPNILISNPVELAAFLTGKDLPLTGYAPFHFPNYEGKDELLDGMWQHELHTVPLLGQAEANIERYIDVAKREAWEGDKRGTTLNLQVGASGDDGYSSQSPTFFPTDTEARIGGRASPFFENNAWYRFTSVTGLSSQNIDSATLSLWGDSTDLGTPLTKVFAEDATAPAAPTDKANQDAKTRTTAGVDWDSPGLSVSAFTTSPSIVTVIQELADSYDSSVIQILHDDDGSSQAGNNIARGATYDGTTSEAAKLDIEHSAGGGGLSIPIAMHYYQQRRR